MSHLEGGPLSAYNSLLDPHLAGYFSNDKMRRHLRRSGLITRNGNIISENSYRINMAKKEHKKHVRDLLAQAIVHKTLDVERNRQVLVKKKLEEISKIELVRRVKADRGRKGDEEILPYLSPNSRKPRPSSVPARRPESGRSSQTESERYSTNDSISGRRRPSSSVGSRGRVAYPSDEIDDKHLRSLPRRSLENYFRTQNLDGDQIPSPYTYPHFNGLMAPSPPKATPRGSGKRNTRKSKKAHVPKETNETKEEASIEGNLMLHRCEPAVKYQEKMQTFATVAMHYFGRDLKLDYERFDDGKDEIVVEQQHCGGNTLIVFKERLASNSDFKFFSRRHKGFPFSLTFYINGVKDSRISTCCEYKHSVGRHLGCKKGHFGMVSVEGAAPCYKCLVGEKLNQESKKKKRKTKKAPRSPQTKEDDIKVPVSETGRENKYSNNRTSSKNKTQQSNDPALNVPIEGDIPPNYEDSSSEWETLSEGSPREEISRRRKLKAKLIQTGESTDEEYKMRRERKLKKMLRLNLQENYDEEEQLLKEKWSALNESTDSNKEDGIDEETKTAKATTNTEESSTSATKTRDTHSRQSTEATSSQTRTNDSGSDSESDQSTTIATAASRTNATSTERTMETGSSSSESEDSSSSSSDSESESESENETETQTETATPTTATSKTTRTENTNDSDSSESATTSVTESNTKTEATTPTTATSKTTRTENTNDSDSSESATTSVTESNTKTEATTPTTATSKTARTENTNDSNASESATTSVTESNTKTEATTPTTATSKTTKTENTNDADDSESVTNSVVESNSRTDGNIFVERRENTDIITRDKSLLSRPQSTSSLKSVLKYKSDTESQSNRRNSSARASVKFEEQPKQQKSIHDDRESSNESSDEDSNHSGPEHIEDPIDETKKEEKYEDDFENHDEGSRNDSRNSETSTSSDSDDSSSRASSDESDASKTKMKSVSYGKTTVYNEPTSPIPGLDDIKKTPKVKSITRREAKRRRQHSLDSNSTDTNSQSVPISEKIEKVEIAAEDRFIAQETEVKEIIQTQETVVSETAVEEITPKSKVSIVYERDESDESDSVPSRRSSFASTASSTPRSQRQSKKLSARSDSDTNSMFSYRSNSSGANERTLTPTPLRRTVARELNNGNSFERAEGGDKTEEQEEREGKQEEREKEKEKNNESDTDKKSKHRGASKSDRNTAADRDKSTEISLTSSEEESNTAGKNTENKEAFNEQQVPNTEFMQMHSGDRVPHAENNSENEESIKEQTVQKLQSRLDTDPFMPRKHKLKNEKTAKDKEDSPDSKSGEDKDTSSNASSPRFRKGSRYLRKKPDAAAGKTNEQLHFVDNVPHAGNNSQNEESIKEQTVQKLQSGPDTDPFIPRKIKLKNEETAKDKEDSPDSKSGEDNDTSSDASSPRFRKGSRPLWKKSDAAAGKTNKQLHFDDNIPHAENISANNTMSEVQEQLKQILELKPSSPLNTLSSTEDSEYSTSDDEDELDDSDSARNGPTLLIREENPKEEKQTSGKEDESDQEEEETDSEHEDYDKPFEKEFERAREDPTSIEFVNTELSVDQTKQLADLMEGKVEQLTLINANITNAHLEVLANVLSAPDVPPTLKTLNLNKNQLTPEAIPHLARILQAQTNIEYLLLSNFKLGGRGCTQVVETLISNNLSSLRQLDLSDCEIEGAGVKILSKLIEQENKLVNISLSFNSATESTWNKLFKTLGDSKVLRTLSLDKCGLTDRNLIVFCDSLRVNDVLTSVDLENNNITDEGAQLLLEIIQNENKSLTVITLTPGNSISQNLLNDIKIELQNRTLR
ncbi:DgyrCDS12214 [Dimorphilus gyrociliatus]|uniref:DgyrCDS12214 n=1 Tax=Dimorphilus gyrociliatus TaxID=2664684 RepID=A0A7I8W5S7_9ANNE|nr:DgyrCDS12214 [Dimorphilus gyrociliatus]